MTQQISRTPTDRRTQHFPDARMVRLRVPTRGNDLLPPLAYYLRVQMWKDGATSKPVSF